LEIDVARWQAALAAERDARALLRAASGQLEEAQRCWRLRWTGCTGPEGVVAAAAAASRAEADRLVGDAAAEMNRIETRVRQFAARFQAGRARASTRPWPMLGPTSGSRQAPHEAARPALRCGRRDRWPLGARRGDDHRLCPWAAGHAAELGHLRAGKTNAATGEVLNLFRDWLEERCRELQPRWIAFEAPYVPQVTPARVRSASGHAVWTMPSRRKPINIHTLRRLISLCGLVEMVAHQHRIECREELPTKITQSFTGHGNWAGRENKKKATIRMCEVYGWPVKNENEADALALWAYAEAVLYPRAAQRRGAGPLFGRAMS
jgi:hypothetical protein